MFKAAFAVRGNLPHEKIAKCYREKRTESLDEDGIPLMKLSKQTAGLARCQLRRTARLLSTEIDADIDSHIDSHEETSSQPMRMREACINQVTLLGRIGSDPRIIEKEDLRKFAIFSLALNESYRNVRTGTTEAKTIWVKILAASQNSLNMAERLGKGDRVFVTGKLLKNISQTGDTSTTILTDQLIRVSRPKSAYERELETDEQEV